MKYEYVPIFAEYAMREFGQWSGQAKVKELVTAIETELA